MKDRCLYRKLLIATDLSEAMTQIIQCVSRIGELFCEEVKLLHVVPGNHGLRDITREMETVIASQVMALQAAGLHSTYSFAFGDPSREITRCIREGGYQFLVIGSHGKTRVEDIFLGSTAAKIIDSVTVPTLLVKNSLSGAAACPLDFTGRFLFLTDFSENADTTFETLLTLAPYFGAAVTLFHAQDLSRLLPHFDPIIEELNLQDKERLLALQKRLHAHGVKDVTLKIESGPPKKTVLNEIRSHKFGMVLLGAQGRDWMEEWMLGSIAHAVSRLSDTSLLLVPYRPEV